MPREVQDFINNCVYQSVLFAGFCLRFALKEDSSVCDVDECTVCDSPSGILVSAVKCQYTEGYVAQGKWEKECR